MGRSARREMFLLAQKQALVTVPLGLAAFVAAHNPAPLFRIQDCVAIAVVLLGIVGEALADRQLRAFIAAPLKESRVLRPWPVGLVSASELLLRVVALARLPAARHRSRR